MDIKHIRIIFYKNMKTLREEKIEIIRNKEFIVNHMQDNFENVIINEIKDGSILC